MSLLYSVYYALCSVLCVTHIGAAVLVLWWSV